MTTTWCWEKIAGLCGCASRENPHDNRPGLLGPVNVETIRIYPKKGVSPNVDTASVDEEQEALNENSDGERGSAEDSAGPSRLGSIDSEEQEADDAPEVVEGGDAEVVVERSVEEVEVTEEVPKLSRFGRLRALLRRGIIHRLRRLSDEAMHSLNIPEHIQRTRRRVRISQVRNWREREWTELGCCTGGRRCCSKRRNPERAVHFGPEQNPDELIEENENLDPVEENPAPARRVEITRKPNDPHIL